jgi:hypothetical protein
MRSSVGLQWGFSAALTAALVRWMLNALARAPKAQSSLAATALRETFLKSYQDSAHRSPAGTSWSIFPAAPALIARLP